MLRLFKAIVKVAKVALLLLIKGKLEKAEQKIDDKLNNLNKKE